MGRPIDIEDIVPVDEALLDRERDGSGADDVRGCRAFKAVEDGRLGNCLPPVEILGDGERDRVALEGLAENVLVTDGDEQPFRGLTFVDDQCGRVFHGYQD